MQTVNYDQQEANIRSLVESGHPIKLILTANVGEVTLEETANKALRVAADALQDWEVVLDAIMSTTRMFVLRLTHPDGKVIDRTLLKLLEQVPNVTLVEADSICHTC